MSGRTAWHGRSTLEKYLGRGEWQSARTVLPANMRRWHNVRLLLAHRLRRWPSIEPALGQRLMLARLESMKTHNITKRHHILPNSGAQLRVDM